MNTVGKPGKLGEHVKCVVSVSMLTEGWDANTVTHILGVRAFQTQLLCEQVVGRGLRRRSYHLNEQGRFDPEYAEVYGVPFSFIPCSGGAGAPPLPVPTTRVRALEERAECAIRFPRVVGYRNELPSERLKARFGKDSKFVLSTELIPTRVENAPIVGETAIHTLDDLKKRRLQEVAFRLAKLVLEKYFRDDAGHAKVWAFPQLLRISREWLDECLVLKDDVFPQLLLLVEFAHEVADRIYRAIVQSSEGEKRLVPILDPYETWGSSACVDFDTSKPVYPTNPAKCHVSHVVADTNSWEQKMAQALESMQEVVHYVKNFKMGFTIPYTLNGVAHNYLPDFIAGVKDSEGATDLLNVVIEVTGERKKEKVAKVSTAKDLWIPAVNNHGGLGRWTFIEIDDPWNAKSNIRAALKGAVGTLFARRSA
ncbi:MAG: hypothetical protein FJ109_18090 [Deltaproteobacteria bacterium]|nr:hypothetical protein [Deltaproteobacteria bacterium]